MRAGVHHGPKRSTPRAASLRPDELVHGVAAFEACRPERLGTDTGTFSYSRRRLEQDRLARRPARPQIPERAEVGA